MKTRKTANSEADRTSMVGATGAGWSAGYSISKGPASAICWASSASC